MEWMAGERGLPYLVSVLCEDDATNVLKSLVVQVFVTIPLLWDVMLYQRVGKFSFALIQWPIPEQSLVPSL